MYDEDEEKKEPADVTARLEEEELLDPGTKIKPGQTPAENQKDVHKAHAASAHSLEGDVVEFNKFAAQQEELQNQPEEKPSKGVLHVIWEVVKTLLVAAVVVVVINTFIFQAYYVSGNSMNPGYRDGDYLLVNKIQTSLRNIKGFFGSKQDLDIKRGDVLVFTPPESPELFYIKRAIALPGERVVLKDGVFTIYNSEHPDGLVLKEPYIDPAYKTEGEVDEVVTPGNVFVVGDNRSPGGSYDSRFWGQLNQDKISGVAFFRLLPINDLGFIQNAIYTNAN